MTSPSITCVGGGHGLSAALKAAKRLTSDVTAVVTTADDGGSSGVLRKHLGIPAPGDVRMAIAALAEKELSEQLIQFRPPEEGALEGHPIGNTMIAALADHHGDFRKAVEQVAEFVGVVGGVIPACSSPVTLKALVAGKEVSGQAAIARGAAAATKIWNEPEVPAEDAAIDAIANADLVVLGPGSLFTSVIAALLPKGLIEALPCAQRVAVVMNLGEQNGETLGMSAAQHVAALQDHAPGIRIDACLIHDGSYEGVSAPVMLDEEELGRANVPIVWAPMRSGRHPSHDPDALSRALASLLSS